jgi:hypothetical protein
MKTISKLMVLLLLSGVCFAKPAASEGEPAAKAHHAKKKKAEKAVACAACEDIKQLKEQIQAQQAEIDQLKGTQPQAAAADEKAAAAAASAASAQQQAAAAAAAAAAADSKASATQSDVAGLKTEVNTATEEAQKAEKKVSDLEHPASIAYKGIKLTPGGFLAAESLWRQHTENADIGSSYNGIPFADSTQYHLTEWRGTARQSRMSLLAEGKAGAAKLTGYYEMDFLGAAATANENQSNSWQPRIRQLFGKVAMNGWSMTAGQTWSLLTLDRKGTEARAEWVPATIDAQYVVGYTWARLMSVRVAKSFADDKATVAFSVENPAMLVAGQAPAPAPVFGGTGSGQLGNGNTYSANLAPDLIAKVAFDPGYGHYEIKAVGRFFRDRIGEVSATTTTPGVAGSNQTTFGGGLGAAAILPLVSKKLDFIAEGLVGRGTARFGDSSNVDVTYRANGSLSPIKNLQALAGIEGQITPKLSMYVYGGDEYLGRNIFGTGATATGYGLPSVKNTTCFEANSNSCSALMKNLIQGTAGFWYNVYKGSYGTLRYGMQYSYTYKNTWAGVNANPGATTGAPKANENMAFTSIRYYIP